MTIFNGDFVMEEGSKFLPLFLQDTLFSSAAINSLCLSLLLHNETDDTARLPTQHSHMSDSALCWKDHLFKPRL